MDNKQDILNIFGLRYSTASNKDQSVFHKIVYIQLDRDCVVLRNNYSEHLLRLYKKYYDECTTNCILENEEHRTYLKNVVHAKLQKAKKFFYNTYRKKEIIYTRNDGYARLYIKKDCVTIEINKDINNTEIIDKLFRLSEQYKYPQTERAIKGQVDFNKQEITLKQSNKILKIHKL